MCVKVGGMQIDFITRWTFAILANLTNVDFVTNLIIIEEIVQILIQDLMRYEVFQLMM